MNFLAEVVAAPSEMIPTAGLVAVLGAISSIIIALVGKHKLDQARSESREVTIRPPVPTVRTQEEPEFVTIEVFNRHLVQMEGSIRRIEAAMETDRGTTRLDNGHIYTRINAISEGLGTRMGKIEGTLDAVSKTTNTLLDIALGKTKPPTRNS